MPAPTNISAVTAIDMGIVLPYNNVQDVTDGAGTTYTVWYKRTAQAGESVLGLFGFGDLVGYKPIVNVYTGPDSAPVPYLAISNQNKPIQFPVTAGTTYFFEFLKNGNFATSNLTLNVQVSPSSIAPIDSILVPDDTNGFPAVILSTTVDYTALRFIYPFPAGEGGDIIASTGRMLFEDIGASQLQLRENDTSFLSNIAFYPDVGNAIIRSAQFAGKFYVGAPNKGGVGVIRTVSNSGVLSSAITLPAAGITALAAKNDESIIYIAGQTVGVGGPIKRWSVGSNAFTTDLAAGVPNYRIDDILVLADDTIIALYFKQSPTRDLFARQYDSSGTILNTYNFGVVTATAPRLAYAPDDPNSFWVWFHAVSPSGVSKFRNIKISDGSTLTERLFAEFENGAYLPGETPSPLARFGPSFSCPFVITRVQIGAPLTGTIRIDKVTNPSGDAQVFSFDTTGLTPNSFTLSDGQSYTYNNVPVGSGYAIVETIPAQWSVAYAVSNGSPISNISVSAGELVIITVTNTKIPNTRSGIYKITPGKRQDTLWNDLNAMTTTDVKIPNPFGRSGLLGE